jgi:hypothetical protein
MDPVAIEPQAVTRNMISGQGGFKLRTLKLGSFFVFFLSAVSVMPAAEAQPLGPLEPPEGALFGAYVKSPTGWNHDEVVASIEALESAIGRRLGIDHHYHPWDLPFPGWKEGWDWDNGRVPMLSWGPRSTRVINSGRLDAVIRSRADGVRDLARPVFLRWFWEMDGDTSSHLSRSPASFIQAWRRIRWIFAQRGAWNAVWVWCPNAWGFTEGSAQKYYPGDAYVDWVCADGYNWAPGRPGDPWRSFGQVFEDFYTWGLSTGKPMMVGEYGCLERAPGEKAAWFEQARTTLKERFGEVDAVVYFNSFGDGMDWRVTTSSSSLQAVSAMGADPYFSPPVSGLGAVDPARFDQVLADVGSPDIDVLGRPRLRAARVAVLRWRTEEPNKDFVRIRSLARGGGSRTVARATSDDGMFRWRVPAALDNRVVRLSFRAFDLAGNAGSAKTSPLRID